MSFFDDDSGYALDDPKHPTWAERMADRADDDRKREKEQGHVPLVICECDDMACRERLDLTVGEYLDLRGRFPVYGGYYVVVRGHAQGTPVVLEAVAASGDLYSVVHAPPLNVS